MPRVHHVKKARKARPQYGIEVGDSYYHWTFGNFNRPGTQVCSKTPPKPSQLTRSEYLRTVYSIQESMEQLTIEGFDLAVMDEFAVEVEQLAPETQDKFENMPEGLQQGDTGQLLEERAENMYTWANALLNIVVPEKDDDEEDYQELLEAAFDEFQNIQPDV